MSNAVFFTLAIIHLLYLNIICLYILLPVRHRSFLFWILHPMSSFDMAQ